MLRSPAKDTGYFLLLIIKLWMLPKGTFVRWKIWWKESGWEGALELLQRLYIVQGRNGLLCWALSGVLNIQWESLPQYYKNGIFTSKKFTDRKIFGPLTWVCAFLKCIKPSFFRAWRVFYVIHVFLSLSSVIWQMLGYQILAGWNRVLNSWPCH